MMDGLLHGLGGIGSLAGYLIPFLFVLTIVVFFHELGHFLVARLTGVKVLTFSVGFGPELLGFNDRYGTRWKISAIPLGGFVKFLGDENAASVPDTAAVAKMSDAEKRVSFPHKSVGARAAIVAAGPIANFILAIVIFAGIFMTIGRPGMTPRVDQIQPGSVAEAAGFQPGDLVLEIDQTPIDSFSDMQRIVSISAGQPLLFTIERNGARQTLTATPALREVKDAFGNTQRIGQLGIARTPGASDVVSKRVDPVTAVKLGASETWFVIERTFSYIGGLFTGRESTDQLGGPIRIAQMSGQVASISFAALLNLAAILSVSIGLLNLFPVPLLDGGHLLFYAFEAVRGKPLSDRAQELGFRVGLALIVMLTIFTTANDIRFVLWKYLQNLFS